MCFLYQDFFFPLSSWQASRDRVCKMFLRSSARVSQSRSSLRQGFKDTGSDGREMRVWQDFSASPGLEFWPARRTADGPQWCGLLEQRHAHTQNRRPAILLHCGHTFGKDLKTKPSVVMLECVRVCARVCWKLVVRSVLEEEYTLAFVYVYGTSILVFLGGKEIVGIWQKSIEGHNDTTI